MEPNFRSRLSCVLWCTARHSLTRVGWPLLRQDPSHQVQRRPDRRLASSQSMRCFYSYLAPLFLFLSWSPSRSVPSSSSSSSCDENGFSSSRIPRMCSSRFGSVQNGSALFRMCSSRISRMCSSRVGSSSLMQDSRKCSSRVGSSSFMQDSRKCSSRVVSSSLMKNFQKCSPRVGSVQCPSRGFVLCPPREFFQLLVRRLVECLPRGFNGCVLHGLVLYRMVPRFSECIPPRRGAHPPSRALHLAQRMWFATHVLRLPPKMRYLSRGEAT